MFLMKEKKYVSNDGLPHHTLLLDSVKMLKHALVKHDFDEIMYLVNGLYSITGKLLPHIQHDQFLKIHSEIEDDARKLIDAKSMRKASLNDLFDLIRKAYKNINTV